MRQCEKCKKQLKSAQSYEYHVKNNVCAPHICPSCKMYYKTRQGLQYHMDHKVCMGGLKKQVVVKIIPGSFVKTCKETINFHNVDMKKVHSRVKNFTELVFNNAIRDIIPKFIENTLCHEYLPEYWSVYISNRSDNFINVFKNSGGWELSVKQKIFSELIEWAIRSMKKYIIDNRLTVKDEYALHYEELARIMYHPENEQIKEELLTEVFSELFCLFHNHKKNIILKNKYMNGKIKSN